MGAQVGQNLARDVRRVRQHDLQLGSQGGLDGRNVFVRDTDAIGQRAEHLLGVLQRGERARAEALAAGFKLLEDVQTRVGLGLPALQLVQVQPRLPDLALHRAQAFLALLETRSACLERNLFGFRFARELFEAWRPRAPLR